MKKVMSVKKHRSSIAKAIHKQKKLIKVAVNKKEQELIPHLKFFRFLQDWFLEIEKRLRNK